MVAERRLDAISQDCLTRGILTGIARTTEMPPSTPTT